MSRAGRSETSTQDANFQKGNNHLLVIGINQYQDSNIPNLRNARKDAEAVAELLQAHYGFEQCTTLYDGKADCESITDTLEALQNKIKAEDNLLIYFAGHGHYNKTAKIGYLLPADAKWGKPHTYLSNSNLLDYVRAINSRHTFLILDSCFSGALFRNVGDTNRAAANLERLPSRWGLAAGLIEEVSDGFYNDNSPFAKALLTFLNTANDTFLASDLIQHVKNAVPNNATQQPHGGILHKVGDQQGEMVFRRISSEEIDWEHIADSQNINDFLIYLKKHRYQSQFDEVALLRIKLLEDQQIWDKVNKGSISELLKFIKNNRENIFISEAEKIIVEIEDKIRIESISQNRKVYRRKKLTYSKTAEDYFNEGHKRWENEEYHEAIKLCNKAIKLNSIYPEAYNRRGASKCFLKEYLDAIADFNTAIDLNPLFAEAYNNRGVAKAYLKQYESAIIDYKKAVEINPDYLNAYNNIAAGEYNLQNYQEAIKNFTKALEINPDDAEIYHHRGFTRYKLKNYEEAIVDYNRAISLNPIFGLAFNNRGVIYNEVGEFLKACKDWKKAIELGENKYAPQNFKNHCQGK